MHAYSPQGKSPSLPDEGKQALNLHGVVLVVGEKVAPPKDYQGEAQDEAQGLEERARRRG